MRSQNCHWVQSANCCTKFF
uniref:Uncharacterized protein n=1 Tax=Anguilla anguilla TaxID=7936 RepID=A0A0E9T6Y9_ANGAN